MVSVLHCKRYQTLVYCKRAGVNAGREAAFAEPPPRRWWSGGSYGVEGARTCTGATRKGSRGAVAVGWREGVPAGRTDEAGRTLR